MGRSGPKTSRSYRVRLLREIETTTPIPFDQAWSRAYKKVGVVVSIAPYAEKYASQGAENGHFPIQKRSLAFEDQ